MNRGQRDASRRAYHLLFPRLPVPDGMHIVSPRHQQIWPVQKMIDTHHSTGEGGESCLRVYVSTGYGPHVETRAIDPVYVPVLKTCYTTYPCIFCVCSKSRSSEMLIERANTATGCGFTVHWRSGTSRTTDPKSIRESPSVLVGLLRTIGELGCSTYSPSRVTTRCGIHLKSRCA